MTILSVVLCAIIVAFVIINAKSKDESKEKDKLSQTETAKNQEEPEISETPETPSTGEPTNNDIIEGYYGDTLLKIEQIKKTESEIEPSENGRSYYISEKGDDSNDGLSPEKPIASINALNKLKLHTGDVVYFERGGIYRGMINADVAGVSYTSYGEGSKPEIYGSLNNYAKTGEWEETDVPDIYVFSEKFTKDVGNIVFDSGKEHGIKCVTEVRNGRTYNITTNLQFDSYADLTEDLHFYHDLDNTGLLYLYCKGRNPSELYDSIEIAERNNIINVRADNILIDNIEFRYCGSHAVGAGTCKGLTVQNCEFYWIGGSIQYDSVRFGNGVEIWGGATDFTVDNCYFNQIYDAAVTFQYKSDENSDLCSHNIKFTNNVMAYCNYSVEYFLDAGDNENNYFEDFVIDGNDMWFAGYGFCEQRPDKKADAHIKSWTHANPNRSKFIISNNIFAFGKNNLIETYSESGNRKPEYDSNIYIQYKNHNLGMNGNSDSVMIFDETAEKNIADKYGDKNAVVILF